VYKGSGAEEEMQEMLREVQSITMIESLCIGLPRHGD
jgi:hypothetical protein